RNGYCHVSQAGQDNRVCLGESIQTPGSVQRKRACIDLLGRSADSYSIRNLSIWQRSTPEHLNRRGEVECHNSVQGKNGDCMHGFTIASLQLSCQLRRMLLICSRSLARIRYSLAISLLFGEMALSYSSTDNSPTIMVCNVS